MAASKKSDGARSSQDIADDIEQAAAGLTGARARKMLALLAELRGEGPPEPTEQEVRDAERQKQIDAEVQAEADRLANDS